MRAKNLKIIFNPATLPDSIQNIVFVIFAIYEAIINICKNKKIYKLKMYLPISYVNSIVVKIAEYELQNNNIRNFKQYTNWVEFEINKNSSKQPNKAK